VRKVVDLIISSRAVVSKLTVISISLGTHSTGMKGVSTAMPPIVLRLHLSSTSTLLDRASVVGVPLSLRLRTRQCVFRSAWAIRKTHSFHHLRRRVLPHKQSRRW